MARTKVDNKLNVVIGTKAQVEADNTIPDNSIVIVTDEELTPSGLNVETWNTATKTLALSDANKLFLCASSGDQKVTIAPDSNVPFPIGTMITFSLIGTSKATFVAGTGVTLNSSDSLVTLATQYAMASLIKIAPNHWQLVGALE